MSRSGSSRRACDAAAIPPASPPITTSRRAMPATLARSPGALVLGGIDAHMEHRSRPESVWRPSGAQEVGEGAEELRAGHDLGAAGSAGGVEERGVDVAAVGDDAWGGGDDVGEHVED